MCLPCSCHDGTGSEPIIGPVVFLFTAHNLGGRGHEHITLIETVRRRPAAAR